MLWHEQARPVLPPLTRSPVLPPLTRSPVLPPLTRSRQHDVQPLREACVRHAQSAVAELGERVDGEAPTSCTDSTPHKPAMPVAMPVAVPSAMPITPPWWLLTGQQ